MTVSSSMMFASGALFSMAPSDLSIFATVASTVVPASSVFSSALKFSENAAPSSFASP